LPVSLLQDIPSPIFPCAFKVIIADAVVPDIVLLKELANFLVQLNS
jgi:hypothetical protein